MFLADWTGKWYYGVFKGRTKEIYTYLPQMSIFLGFISQSCVCTYLRTLTSWQMLLRESSCIILFLRIQTVRINIRIMNLQLKIAPEQLLLVYNPEISCYQGEMSIKNNGNHVLYIRPASTFGSYFKFICPRELTIDQEVTARVTVKPTNQISANSELLTICYGHTPLLMDYIPSHSANIAVPFKFQIEIVEDQAIEEMLSAEAEDTCTQANLILAKGDYKQAAEQFEEAFQLYRPCTQALYGLSVAYFELKRYDKALEAIEAAMVTQFKDSYLLHKMRVQIQRLQSQKNISGSCVQFYQAELKLIRRDKLTESQEQILRQAQKWLKTKLYKQGELDSRAYFDKLKEIAKQNWHSSAKLATLGFTTEEIEERMNAMVEEMDIEKDPVEETPSEILDPISYEIMTDPVILPSGNSYEKKTLNTYFVKNGYKDPYSRIDIRPQWIFPNKTLREYIQRHPKLPMWKQYEEKQCKMT